MQAVAERRPEGRKRLTARQGAFLNNLAKGMPQSRAAVAAGYSSRNPRQSGYQALEQLRKTAPDLLAAHGLDLDTLIDKYLLPLMNATDTKSFPYIEKHGEKTVHKIATRKKPSWNARAKGLDIVCKIGGYYVRQQENKGPEFSVVMLNASNRPDWAAMRRAQPKIEVPGLNAPAKEEE